MRRLAKHTQSYNDSDSYKPLVILVSITFVVGFLFGRGD